MIEIFADITGSFGNYQVSNFGRIKSFKLNKEKILKQRIDFYGYSVVNLYLNGKHGTFRVHQLVAMAFLNHVPNGHKLVVNHKNFIRTDNRLENLEIVTNRENSNQKHLTSSSKYTGVTCVKYNKKWASHIFVNNKLIYLGSFDNEKEASEYYENALLAIKNGTEIQIKKAQYSSKYKGVSFHKSTNKWRAYINDKENKKTIHLGTFDTEERAYKEILNFKKL